MSDYRLTSKSEASAALGDYFQLIAGAPSLLMIREDKCFKDTTWLNLGTLVVEPGDCEPGEEINERYLAAVNFGFFEWTCPAVTTVMDKLVELLEITKEDHKAKAGRALDEVTSVAARVGLVHPFFDADSISLMPFRRPTTVVADTSAILQGGLDFVVRFLYPMARLKVPAIAHMEILNSADNYFKYRRTHQKVKDRAAVLLSHAISQGGQRALLRLELQTDAEIERGRLGADPLRGIIQSESDAEDTNLGLQKVQRSFADRLIFETARQHLSQSSPDHPVTLMTADQGLARMTLGEGMQPLFFEAVSYPLIAERRLSGTTFNPFTGRIYSVSVADLLWEMAVTFGRARLATEDDAYFVEACAMEETLSWKPYHAKDDLLWVRIERPAGPLPIATPTPPGPVFAATPAPTKTMETSEPKKEPRSYAGSYKFSVPKLFKLIDVLASSGSLSTEDSLAVLGIKSTSPLEDYRNFLMAGKFIEGTSSLVATDLLRDLVKSLKAGDLSSATSLLRHVPSFASFYDFLAGSRPDNPIAERARNTYTALAEVLGIAFEIPGERLYPAFSHPTTQDFAELALRTYHALGGGPDRYVLTGLWLETLVREAGVHPITSRSLLELSRLEGLLERFTEGSTPETIYQNHTLNVLDTSNGGLGVRRVGIFEGDFLLPGKSSVSLRLKRGNHEPS